MLSPSADARTKTVVGNGIACYNKGQKEGISMKIYDISQKLFSCCVFPGDLAPSKKQVPPGQYLLNAAPVNLGGADGAFCRAVLIDMRAE